MKGKSFFSPAIVIATGLIVLAGYFIDLPVLSALRSILMRWAVILSATALLVGVANLFLVHWRKATSGDKGAFYSMVLVFSLIVTIGIAGYFSPTSAWSMWMYQYIQVPVETSLMAILAVTLITASVRLLRRKIDMFSAVFILTLLAMLIGTAPLFGVEIPGFYGPDSLRNLIMQIPAVAGARGLLLGVALGTIATGLRVLLGAERPYGG